MMRLVLTEKHKLNKFLTILNKEIISKGISDNDKILFISKNIIIFKDNKCTIYKPNNKQKYTIQESKIGAAFVCNIDSVVKEKQKFFTRNQTLFMRKLDSLISCKYNYWISIFSNDNFLKDYHPTSFIEKYEEEIMNIILRCNENLKYIINNINNLNEVDVKKLIKEYSMEYKFHRKKINTKMSMDEKKRIAKESRLSSCKQLSHSGMHTH